MEKIDARKLTPRELSEKRKIAMKLREKGISNKEVAEIVGISAQTISTYYTQYKKDGAKMFKVKNAGRPKNVGKTLSDEQEAKIIRRLIDTILYYQSLSSAIQKCTKVQSKNVPLCNTYLLEISNNPASLFCFNL